MEFVADASLLDCNTLRLPARAEWCVGVTTHEELAEALAFARGRGLSVRVLGGGSNVVLHERISGCVVLMRMGGEQVLDEDGGAVRIRVAAGTPWHGFVLACHARGWHGLENLALIPGTVGAAPVQNIGAYGLELAAFVEEVRAISRVDGTSCVFSRADCRFGYRTSIFKEELAERMVITDVTLKLPYPAIVQADYPALREALGGDADPTPAAVLQAVVDIRRARLPDPSVEPNVGSFFHNPVIDRERFDALRARRPDVVHWVDGNHVKLAAAWLVEQAGGKAMREGPVGVHERQALVLVNEGGASAWQVLELARRIIDAVRRRFGVELRIEPAIY